MSSREKYADWKPEYSSIKTPDCTYNIYDIKSTAFPGLGIMVVMRDGTKHFGVPTNSPDKNVLLLTSLTGEGDIDIKGKFRQDFSGHHLRLEDVKAIYHIKEIRPNGQFVVVDVFRS